MSHSRFNVVIAAKTCLRDRKHCPRTCPLFQEEHCQKIICRELIKIYNETGGQIPYGEDEPIHEEEKTQTDS